MDLERMRARLAALQEARNAGVRSVSYDGKTISYGSDADLANTINDLETRIAAAQRSYAAQKAGQMTATCNDHLQIKLTLAEKKPSTNHSTIITARRKISRLVLKYRKGERFVIRQA
jgi:hypothetical protein